MQKIREAFEEYAIQTDGIVDQLPNLLTFRFEQQSNLFVCALVQVGYGQFHLRAIWDVQLHWDDFDELNAFIDRMVSARFVNGAAFADGRDGYLINDFYLQCNEPKFSAEAVPTLLKNLLTPFSEFADRMLQMTFGILTADQAVENFSAWCRRCDTPPGRPDGGLPNDRGFLDTD